MDSNAPIIMAHMPFIVGMTAIVFGNLEVQVSVADHYIKVVAVIVRSQQKDTDIINKRCASLITQAGEHMI